jgi:GcrA cell cycle regulator
MMLENIWTNEREEELGRLWNAGFSAAQIAKVLGCFDSSKDKGRSAVMGKVHRMGLQRYGKKSPEQLALEAEARLVRSEQLAKARYERELASRRKVVEMLETAKMEEEQNRSSLPFNDLRMFSRRTSNECRFPLNDAAPFIACGAVTPPGESWCPHCREIVMAKPAPVLSDERALPPRHGVQEERAF